MRPRGVYVEAAEQSRYSNPAASSETIKNDKLVATIRKYLHDEEGWEHQWIDSVADRIRKRMLVTDLEKVKTVLNYLKSSEVGLSSQAICNMASISSSAFGKDLETEIKPVIQYIKNRGANEATLKKILTTNPKVLEYAIYDDGKKLWKRTNNSKFLAFAEVDVKTDGDKQSAHVAYFRENTAFETAPVSPFRPDDAN